MKETSEMSITTPVLYIRMIAAIDTSPPIILTKLTTKVQLKLGNTTFRRVTR